MTWWTFVKYFVILNYAEEVKWNCHPTRYIAGSNSEYLTFHVKSVLRGTALICDVSVNKPGNIHFHCVHDSLAIHTSGAAACWCPKNKNSSTQTDSATQVNAERKRLVFLALWTSTLSCIKVCVLPAALLLARQQCEGGQWVVTSLL